MSPKTSRKITWINVRPQPLTRGEEFLITDREERTARRQRQAREFEDNQQELRTSIEQSKKLVDEADAMIRRYRKECDTAGDAGSPADPAPGAAPPRSG